MSFLIFLNLLGKPQHDMRQHKHAVSIGSRCRRKWTRVQWRPLKSSLPMIS